MFLVRRVFKVKPRTARQAAELITKMGKLYEEAGQRSPCRVYISGGSVTGPANTVYMDWIEEAIQSPYREGNKLPEGIRELVAQVRELQEESDVIGGAPGQGGIEFYELYSPR